jgi:hypothetical protein
MARATRVYIETGKKRVFASAADWPGWARSGKDEASALASLAAYAPRYARVAKLARVEFPKDATEFEVVERSHGDASTDFGVPHTPAKDEEKRMTPAQVERMVALTAAAWKYFDQVAGKAPKTLRKGPRGGGRDTDKIVEHVLGSEPEYAKRIGVRMKPGDRGVLLESFKNPNRTEKWPVRYTVRRTAWHALDHAWEIEDRLP